MPSNYPDTCVAKITWSRISNTQAFTSPFTSSTQTVGMSGALWKAQINHGILTDVDFNVIHPFIVGLRGRAGRFYLTPYQYQKNLTNTTGRATGTALTLNSSVAGLGVGDYISVNYELKMLIAGSGTSWTVDTPFRQIYSGVTIELNKPSCLMMLINDDFPMTFEPPLLSSATVECIEAIV